MEDRIMLVLSRKVGEAIHIDGKIKVKIVRINGNRVKIGIEAPKEVHVVRCELGEWSDISFHRHSPPDSSLGSNFMASMI
ncbi:carbon storage regulator [Bythopirellula goksoeyrii]|uniref:carbon storage regulator n=1 Tax=Bythopirellula goksoeyrii TaxID=1400387 RepID=UPI0028F44DEF|nr:carbon storage regulator [Bythopirellula goksoeyrii]